MGNAEIRYTFRVAFPSILERERTQLVSLEAERDGALVAPSSGTYELIRPDGTTVVGPSAVVITGGIATFSVTAAVLPSTLGYGEGYQERWALVMPDTTTRTVRREAAVARFVVYPPLRQSDIVTNEYPDLVEQLGVYGASVQPWLDGAWGFIMRKMFKAGAWPELIVSQSDFYEPLRHETLYRIFKFLSRRTAGESRWHELMELHKSEFKTEWSTMTSIWDRDQSGFADDLGRKAVATAVHLNVAYRRTMPRDPRFF